MSSTALTALFDGLLDDAAMFPPEDAPLADAVVGHAAHRLAWYSDLVAAFVCAARPARYSPAGGLARRAGWHRRSSGGVGRRGQGPPGRGRRAGGSLRHDRTAA